jgi:hypothetical protein
MARHVERRTPTYLAGRGSESVDHELWKDHGALLMCFGTPPLQATRYLGGRGLHLHPTPIDVHVLPTECHGLSPAQTGPGEEEDDGAGTRLSVFACVRQDLHLLRSEELLPSRPHLGRFH